MTIGDKCPYCGRELLSGYLQSARQIIWSQEEKSISFRADEEGDLVVSHGIWEGSFADCRYCADCGIFLLESLSVILQVEYFKFWKHRGKQRRKDFSVHEENLLIALFCLYDVQAPDFLPRSFPFQKINSPDALEAAISQTAEGLQPGRRIAGQAPKPPCGLQGGML